MAAEETEAALEVELGCPECGARVVVGIWDHSVRCAYCGSLLICGRALGEEVFAVPPARSGPVDAVDLIVRAETESLRSELTGRANDPERPSLDLPALIDLRVEALRARLLSELEQVETVDFLVPYELHEQTVVQGILGRRGGGKACIVQSYRAEDLERRYDARSFNLRDRGLKIRFSRLTLLSDAARERAGDRFLERVEAAPQGRRIVNRARWRADPTLQVIAQAEGLVRERRLSLWKPMSFARVRRGSSFENHLVDRQFETLAGVLRDDEAARFRVLAPRPLEQVVAKPSVRAIASECPNCGSDLALRPRARIAFCATCGLGVRVLAEGLQAHPYLRGDLTRAAGVEATIGFPFWSFPFRVRAAGREYTRVWSWLEAVSPQPAAVRFREQDPEQSRLFVPARPIFGARELDEAFSALAACAGWRQPPLRRERFAPSELAAQLHVELEPGDAAALARFALLALHDGQSTRSLNGANFKKLVADAELAAGEPELVVLPLPIHDGQWLPLPRGVAPDPAEVPPPLRPVPRALLEDDGQVSRVTRAFSLH